VLFDDNSFLSRYIRDPEQIGAIAPATQTLAQKVASTTHEIYEFCIATRGIDMRRFELIELGAGTGALTRSIDGLNPILIEHDKTFSTQLRRLFPYLEVRTECATKTLGSLTHPVGVVTSIPLHNNPQSKAIKHLLAKGYANGLIKFCVLYTYGFSDPLAGAGFSVARRQHFVLRSLPPASVWVYQ
jgi:phosphatidylethanolamine/phosphatidyl-N-methylethanolamine N-methyltransferase